MPALIFLVIATAGENLFGFLSQLAYNSGILSKFAIARGSAYAFPFFSAPTFQQSLNPLKEALSPNYEVSSAQMTLQNVLTGFSLSYFLHL